MEQDDGKPLPGLLPGQAHPSGIDKKLPHSGFSTIRVMDVTEQTFTSAVIDRSHEVPVVVDFWAEWCGPCRQLGPLLDRAAAAQGGAVELVKVDVDANPGLSQRFRIQGIPAVKAFKEGKVVAEFVGAQPPTSVERFFEGLVPSPADRLIAAGDEASLRAALEHEPTRPDAAVPLARILHRRGERDEAAGILSRVPGSFAADGLAARIRLEAEEAASPDNAPGLAAAFDAYDSGDERRALDLLLEALPSADGARDDLRQVIVGILDELGAESPLAREARRRLATALY